MSYQFIFINFKLYRILFNSTTNYDEVYLTFDNNILNNYEVMFRIKEKSYENYFMSIVWYAGVQKFITMWKKDTLRFKNKWVYVWNAWISKF